MAVIALVVGVPLGCEPTPSPSNPAADASAAAVAECPPQHVWPPLADLKDIRAEIERQVMAELLSIGDGAGTVGVGLRSTGECLARELFEAYGRKLELTVGVQPFPPRPGAGRNCPVGPWPFGSIPFLQTDLVLQPPRVERGQFFKGGVRFTNRGSAPLHVDTSSNFVVYVFQPGRGPVGGSEGGQMGTGLLFDLAPGQSRVVDAFGGTASCDPALGYVLPPGSYEARALVDFSAPEGGNVHVFWSDALLIEVVAP